MFEFFRRRHGIVWVLSILSVAVVVFFGILVVRYDPSARGSYGIALSVAKQVGTAYGPLVVASISGFWDVLRQGVRYEGDPRGVDNAKVQDGLGVVYLLSVPGPVVAAISLHLLATGVPYENALYYIGVAATVWGATIGATHNRFLRDATPGAASHPPGGA